MTPGSPRWHDWDRRLIGWFLAALCVLVMLFGDPTPEIAAGRDRPPASPANLCDALDVMASVRDDLVAGGGRATVDLLREAATRTADIGARTEGLDPRSEAGLEFFTGLFLALPAEPTTQQLLDAGTPASVTDQAHTDALLGWIEHHCG